ncbi:hypothetical protein [Thermomonospora cellulosilytica]|uniref:GerMN domain-containing protein n=1 Tax=Thermomonospora cellulosilytica TaxID=1411118 RepID=A0A7W3MU77_9ACTN|nr:hypothetical protein [Thermomonospora cellulosilytica]MBA9001961.1 hypothetical protein [Thermomonospora cellulosilytica]
MRRPRGIAPIMVAALLAAGCGIRPTGVVGAGDRPTVGARTGPITVYLVQGDLLVQSVRPGLPGHPYHALTQLGMPPTAHERARGLHSEIPVRSIVARADRHRPDEVSFEVEGDMITLRGLRRRGWTRLAQGQVVCTAAAIPGIAQVTLLFDDGSGAFLVCDNFSDLLSGPA